MTKIQEQSWHNLTRYLIYNEGGSIQLMLYPDNKAYMCFLWVDEEYRGKGYGGVLFKVAEYLAIESNCTSIVFEWDIRDSPKWVLEWYLRMGYSIDEINSRNDEYALLTKRIK